MKGEKKTKFMNFRAEPRVFKLLHQMARAEQRTVSNMVEVILTKAVNRYEKENPNNV